MSNFLINSPRCVFIHIPKTAGTSIRNGFFNKDYQGPVFGHVPEEWNGYFSFAFVRNPYDRLVSAWKMFTVGTENLKDDFPQLTLREFLDIVTDESIIFDERRKSYEERIRHHSIPQTHPFNCLRQAKFIGRTETIDEDFRKICSKIDVAHQSLPKMHYTRRDDYRNYFDKETISITNRYFAEDFAKLKYKTI